MTYDNEQIHMNKWMNCLPHPDRKVWLWSDSSVTEKTSPLPVALICNLHSKLPCLKPTAPQAHFLLFEHLISLSKYSSAFSFGEYACLPASSSSSPHLWHGVGLADLLGQVLPKSQPPGVQSISRSDVPQLGLESTSWRVHPADGLWGRREIDIDERTLHMYNYKWWKMLWRKSCGWLENL